MASTEPAQISSGDTEPTAPPPRGVVAACLGAVVTLTAIEVVRWVGLRHYQPVGYYATCVGLAVGSTLVLGVLARLVGLSTSLALALWAGATAALVVEPTLGVAVAVGTAIALVAGRRIDRPAAWLEGASVGAALAMVLLKGEWVGDRIPALDDAISVPLAGAFLMGVLLYLVPLAAVRFHGPLRAAAWAAVPILLSLWFALEPWTHRPDGLHRRPDARFAQERPVPADAADKPDMIVLVLDTLRADRMSVYGYERRTTPELERWMQARPNAVAFPAAYSNGTWTVPSHASLFTGLLPREHGAHFDLDGTLRTNFAFHEGAPRLAQLLQDEGYATLGTFANYWLRVVRDMRTGFDRFFRVIHFEQLPFLGEALRDTLIPGHYMEVTKGGSRGALVNRSLLELAHWWDQGVDNPLFLFANYGDTHGPLAPPLPYRGTYFPSSFRDRAEHISLAAKGDDLERLSSRYDEELLYLDAQLGALFQELDDSGFLDGAWVFITSDHGEAFAEHGVTEHGTTVHEEVIRVPLLVFPPNGVEIPVSDVPVSLVDVSATVAAIAGTTIQGSPGRDLRSPTPDDHIASIEFYGDRAKARVHGAIAALPQRSIRSGRWKLVERGQDDELELSLYDLSSVEQEKRDVAAEHPDVVERLRALLGEYGEPARGQYRVDDDVQDQLGDLGYKGDVAPDEETEDEPPQN